MSVKLIDVFQQYPSAKSPLYDNFCAEFDGGKVHVILGASGSGKTTLLNVVADLCNHGGTVERGVASYIFQEPTLIDNVTVRRNLELVLRGAEKDKAAIKQKVDEYLRLTEINEYADEYPDNLSGGQRQRVAIARAFVYPSDVLLMDEPFNSLDYAVKQRIIKQWLSLFDKSPRTTLFVTHDVDEALKLADEIYLLEGVPATLRHVATLSDDKSSRDVLSDEYISLKRNLIEQL